MLAKISRASQGDFEFPAFEGEGHILGIARPVQQRPGCAGSIAIGCFRVSGFSSRQPITGDLMIRSISELALSSRHNRPGLHKPS